MAEQSRSGRGRTVTIISLRVVRGLVGAAAAAAIVAAVGLIPLPSVAFSPLETTVRPQPASPLIACTGALLRLGDDTGANASQPSPVGVPRSTVAEVGGIAQTAPLAQSDAGTGGGAQAPSVLTMPASADAALAGAQAESADGADGLRGLATSNCAEPRSSAWLVGGSTSVGRTTLLLLANPTEVTAQVGLEVWGEHGPVTAPGMSGITVVPGGQRIIPLAGFAPDLDSPVVHVTSRGGQVVAALQSSVIRVLEPGGVDVVGAGSSPALTAVVPAVRIFDQDGVGSALGLADYADLDGIARVGNPGAESASVELSLTPSVEGGVATSFEFDVDAGTVVDIPLSSALELGAAPIADGSYTVSFRANVPIVAGVRTATTPVADLDADGEPLPGPADLAWFPTSPMLSGDALFAVADAPNPVLVVVNAENAARTVSIDTLGGKTLSLELPPAGSASLELEPDTGYLVRAAGGLRAGVTFADTGQLAGYALRSPRAADSPIVVRP